MFYVAIPTYESFISCCRRGGGGRGGVGVRVGAGVVGLVIGKGVRVVGGGGAAAVVVFPYLNLRSCTGGKIERVTN